MSTRGVAAAPSPDRCEGTSRWRAYPPAYRSLDAWRALAAIGVVIFHESQGILAMNPAAARPPWLYTIASFGWLGVEVFFVISGYCIAAAAAGNARRGADVRSFFLARARRIYPPYWAAVAAVVFFALSLQFGSARGLLPESVLRSPLGATRMEGGLTFWLANVGLLQVALGQGFVYTLAWTLCYEVAFYAIVGVTLWLVGRAWGGTRVLAALNALTVAVSCVVAVTHARVGFPFDMWPLFGSGAAVMTLLSGEGGWRSRGGLLATAAIASSAAAYGFLAGAGGTGTISVAAQPTGPVFWALVVFVALLLRLRRWDARLAEAPGVRHLVRVGTFSYSLYLTHFIGLSLVRGGLTLAGVPDEWDVIKMVLSVVVSISIAYVFFVVVERPFMSSGRKPKVEGSAPDTDLGEVGAPQLAR